MTRVTYVDGQTVIHAENLNDIQDEIISIEENTYTKSEIDEKIGNIESALGAI